MADAPTLPSPPAATAPAAEAPKAKRKIRIGEANLGAFYHVGAVVRNLAGVHLKVLEAWGPQTGPQAKGKIGARVVRCDEKGVVAEGAHENYLFSPPSTRLNRSADKGWKGEITLVHSENPLLVDGTKSTAASILVAPFGFQTGKMLGEMNKFQRADMEKEAKNKAFHDAIAEVQNFPGVEDKEPRRKLSEEGLRRLREEQARLVKSIPLEHVIESYLGLVPSDTSGGRRKYEIEGNHINVTPSENSFGSLNGYRFQHLNGRKGSTNNAADLVVAVQEMQGLTPNFANGMGSSSALVWDGPRLHHGIC